MRSSCVYSWCNQSKWSIITIPPVTVPTKSVGVTRRGISNYYVLTALWSPKIYNGNGNITLFDGLMHVCSISGNGNVALNYPFVIICNPYLRHVNDIYLLVMCMLRPCTFLYCTPQLIEESPCPSAIPDTRVYLVEKCKLMSTDCRSPPPRSHLYLSSLSGIPICCLCGGDFVRADGTKSDAEDSPLSTLDVWQSTLLQYL